MQNMVYKIRLIKRGDSYVCRHVCDNLGSTGVIGSGVGPIRKTVLIQIQKQFFSFPYTTVTSVPPHERQKANPHNGVFSPPTTFCDLRRRPKT